MLEVQKYLKSGKTLDDLKNDYAIKATFHPTVPLVILNYDQIESSPKTNPIVRECRALTLDTRNWEIVCRSFSRFFNWGEVSEEMSLFNFNDFVVDTKEDGSLVTIYFFEGKWYANTRASFAQDLMQGSNITWEQGFCQALGLLNLQDFPLSSNYNYVCEFCSPYNKVVRKYNKPQMYFLTAFQGETEVPYNYFDMLGIGPLLGLLRPKRHLFKSIEEIQDYLQEQGTNDPTFEGVVIRDSNNQRWKIKSATYLGLHRLRGEGDNIFQAKHLLPFILANEESELLTYYDECSETYFKLKSKVLELYIDLLKTWIQNHQIESQKDFALAVKNKPFSGILFSIRKENGLNQTVEQLSQIWRKSDNLILKCLSI